MVRLSATFESPFRPTLTAVSCASTYELLGGLKEDSFACWNIGTVSAEVVISRHVADAIAPLDRPANKRA